jgi:glycosyltransferase involved in cell wall biosynthesis
MKVMKTPSILLLTPQLPYPPHQGTSLRNWHVLRGLALSHPVSLLSFVEPNQTTDAAAIQPLLDVCRAVRTVPVPQRSTALRLRQLLTTRLPDMAHRLYAPAFALSLRQWLTETQFDIVQVEGIELARYIGIIREASPTSRILFDDHNAETELQRRNFLTDVKRPGRWPAAAYSFVQTYRLRRFESWAMRQADWVVAVSDEDARQLQKLVPEKTVTVIPNSIDTEVYQSRSTHESLPNNQSFDLVFTGKMDYRPNVDAVLWFIEAIWPQIRAARPQTTLAIVGQKLHERLQSLGQQSGITLTGWVDSVQPYLAGAGLCLMPFRVGSGTRLKLIEAMAAGKAIVSTTVGAEGFPVQSGREIVLADSPGEFAQAVLALLSNEDERERLGAAAQQFARQYDWRVVVPLFSHVYES